MGLNPLERRIVDLSYKHRLSHITSCLNCVNLIDWIYSERKEDEPFVLDNSHAALALYTVLEKRGLCDAEEMVEKHGTHAGRDAAHGIWVSGGSLGQPASVSVGLALGYPERKVWLVTSDGACMEGCVYEAMRFANQHCPNLEIYVVFNGYGAYGRISTWDLPRAKNVHLHRVNMERYPEFLRGLSGHYLVLNQEQFEELMA